MKIFVLNSGSSSVKCRLFDNENTLFIGHIDGIGLDNCKVILDIKGKVEKKSKLLKNHTQAIEEILKAIIEKKVINSLDEIDAVGHRVLHGGEKYHHSVLINEEVINDAKSLYEFGPLHLPANVLGIEACKKKLPSKPQVAVYDTEFHGTIPPHRYVYAIPWRFYEKHKIRKYGFHGTSHRYVSRKATELFRKEKIITCHLGNGGSVSAVFKGECIDTSMGLTPLQGIIMGTRCGDIDPTIITEIQKKDKATIDDAMNILNKESGLKGISGYSDMRTILKNYEQGNKKSMIALNAMVESIVKYISYYIALLSGVDIIVFTGGIGENASFIREKVISYFDYMGIFLNLEKNLGNEIVISSEKSKTIVTVIKTNEELAIAHETEKVIKNKS